MLQAQATPIKTLYLFILGGSNSVRALPMENETTGVRTGLRSETSTTSYSAGATAGGSRITGKSSVPIIPPLKGGFTDVTVEKLKGICKEVHDLGLDMIASFLHHDNRMPDERGLSDQLLFLLRKIGGVIVGSHTQNVEGQSGTDYYIKLSLKDQVEDISSKLEKTSISGSKTVSRLLGGIINSQRTSGTTGSTSKIRKPKASTPKGAVSEVSEPKASTSQVLAENKKKYIIIIQAKSSKPRGEGNSQPPSNLTPHEQALLDERFPEDDTMEIDFTAL
ncbi:hypothetical protein FRC18_004038 [Serendipita sp. 400]|nr:hypothetical protein FRC18_004038 [Serendipita sp. 400]